MPCGNQFGQVTPPDEPNPERLGETAEFRRRLDELKGHVKGKQLLDQADKIRREQAGGLDPETPPVASQPFMGNPRPYTVVGQAKLFKSGLMGSAVTIWSKVDGEGGHPPTQVMHDAEQPVMVGIDSEEIDQQIAFACGYIYGWVEKVGGDEALERLDIWLEPYNSAGS